MKDTLQIKQFWGEYCATQPNIEACLAEPYDSWDFGDSPDMADELGQLAWTARPWQSCSARWRWPARLTDLGR